MGSCSSACFEYGTNYTFFDYREILRWGYFVAFYFTVCYFLKMLQCFIPAIIQTSVNISVTDLKLRAVSQYN